MILPILSYGHSILKQVSKEVPKGFPNLDELIADMYETMYNARGCGLAAPQIGKALQIFIVNSESTYQNLTEEEREIYFDKNDSGICETFINASIINYSQDLWEDEEGCLSIPNLSQKVVRPHTITIEYYNAKFRKQVRIFGGTTARMIQHEYDHTQGILYLDYLKPLTKKLMESKLKKIMKGQIKSKYPMKFV